jgi:hypothetical protein
LGLLCSKYKVVVVVIEDDDKALGKGEGQVIVPSALPATLTTTFKDPADAPTVMATSPLSVGKVEKM